MRIHAIRGGNLASLSERFEIDLDSEPLRSAGLFAITGETGAGKSTILDAMCLGLYGNCPRLSSSGVNDDVPDIADETIKSSDPRAILRRGAAHGFAEVDFTGHDGVRYRASWAARRARGRAEGKLQNVERALIRIDDGSVLESQTNSVRDRVTEITGLTYEEFRRTVLLAQGDFDAFLRANTQERAALLEKVTGTELYREISKRIYELHEKANDALEKLELRRAATPILPDEMRQALQEEGDRLGNEIGVLVLEISAIDIGIGAHEGVRNARELIGKATSNHEVAHSAVSAAAGDRTHLRRLEAALTLRAEHARLDAAAKKMSRLRAAEAKAREAQANLVGELKTATGDHAAAEAAHLEAEESFKAFGPAWSEATRLDGQIRSAIEELKNAQEDLAKAASAQRSAAASLKTFTDQRQAAEEARDVAEAQKARAPNAYLLADRWSEIKDLIAERGEMQLASAAAARRAEEARNLFKAAQVALAEIATADEADRASIKDLEDVVKNAQERLREIGKNDPAARMHRLADGAGFIREMIRAAQEHERGERDSDEAVRRLATQDGELRQQIELYEKAVVEIGEFEASVKALEKPVDRVEAAASEQAARMRQHLQEGEPCPVCGSTEHPVHQDAALSELAREMRKQLEEARSAAASARQREADAGRKIDAAKLAISQAADVAKTAAEVVAVAAGDYAEALEKAKNTGLVGLPPAPSGAKEALQTLSVKIEVRRQEISGLIVEQGELQEKIEATRRQVSNIGTALDTRARQREIENAKAAEERGRAAIEDQKAEQAKARIARIDAQIAPALSAVQRSTDSLDTDAAGTRDRLAKLVQWWRDQIAALETAEKTLKELAPKISAAEADEKSSGRVLEEHDRILKNRANALGGLTDQRGNLLGGEATEIHRTRHNERRLKAASIKEEFAGKLSDVRSRKSGADERLQACLDEHGPAHEEEAGARADLDIKLAAAGFDLQELGALIAEGAAEADRLRGKLKALDEALTGAASTLKARNEDLDALLEKGLPEETEADLRTLKATKEESRERMRERTGEIAGLIRSDDETREKLKDLDREIKGAKEARDTWAAVNEAVGSRQGGKFAQIAQAVTLSLLVDRANRHLEDLKPRYQLAQGGDDLALHIVDRDMGDEVRSTRSLSGGERFLVSLALALALSQMGSKGGLAATLFIDEGFGSLDSESLDIAMGALEALRAQGRMVGVISHVEAMKERIPIQLRVTRRGAGVSTVELAGVD